MKRTTPHRAIVALVLAASVGAACGPSDSAVSDPTVISVDAPASTDEPGWWTTITDTSTSQSRQLSVPADLLFQPGQSELDPAAAAELAAFAEDLPEGARLRVVGHTDHRGTDAHNQRLGLARARAPSCQYEGCWSN